MNIATPIDAVAGITVSPWLMVVCSIERRMRSVEPAPYVAADYEHRRGFAMVRPAIGVFGNAPAELRKRHRQGALIVAVRREIAIKSGDAVGEFAQEAVLHGLL